MSLVCRVCLQNAPIHQKLNSAISDGVQLCQMLNFVIPEMYLGVSKSPIICNDCSQSLVVAYKFRKKCLETEGHISSFLLKLRNNHAHIDLYDVMMNAKQNQVPKVTALIEDSNPFSFKIQDVVSLKEPEQNTKRKQVDKNVVVSKTSTATSGKNVTSTTQCTNFKITNVSTVRERPPFDPQEPPKLVQINSSKQNTILQLANQPLTVSTTVLGPRIPGAPEYARFYRPYKGLPPLAPKPAPGEKPAALHVHDGNQSNQPVEVLKNNKILVLEKVFKTEKEDQDGSVRHLIPNPGISEKMDLPSVTESPDTSRLEERLPVSKHSVEIGDKGGNSYQKSSNKSSNPGEKKNFKDSYLVYLQDSEPPKKVFVDNKTSNKHKLESVPIQGKKKKFVMDQIMQPAPSCASSSRTSNTVSATNRVSNFTNVVISNTATNTVVSSSVGGDRNIVKSVSAKPDVPNSIDKDRASSFEKINLRLSSHSPIASSAGTSNIPTAPVKLSVGSNMVTQTVPDTQESSVSNMGGVANIVCKTEIPEDLSDNEEQHNLDALLKDVPEMETEDIPEFIDIKRVDKSEVDPQLKSVLKESLKHRVDKGSIKRITQQQMTKVNVTKLKNPLLKYKEGFLIYDHDYLRDYETDPNTRLNFHCYICDSEGELSSVEEHMESHADPRGCFCRMCNRRFGSPFPLNKHLMMHTIICKVCKMDMKLYTYKEHLETHSKLHLCNTFDEPCLPKEYHCMPCGIYFVKEYLLEEHRKLEHKDDVHSVVPV